MTKKNTKRALLLSCITMLMCLSMLVGSTFAWFSDTATTGVNTIQSGTLDVGLVDKDGNSLEGKSLSFADVNGNTDILWEPGVTFLTQGFKVVNNGNLEFKYQIIITGLTGDSKLLEVISFSIVDENELAAALSGNSYTDLEGEWQITFDPDGKPVATQTSKPASGLMYLMAHMDEEAGNEYQNLTLEGIGITVLATQDTVENDSFGNQYDKDAEWPVVDAADLDDALAAAKPGDTIALTAGVTYELPATLPEGVNIDGNGATIAIPKADNYSRLYVEGTTITDAVIEGTNIVTSGDITFVGCTFNGNLDNAVPSDNVVFTDCVFNANVHFASGSGAEVPGSNFVATNCVFNKMVTLADFENATFTGCEFYGNNWAGKNVITYVTVGVNTFTDCTFTTGIRAAGQTADKFVITSCNIDISDVSNLG